MIPVAGRVVGKGAEEQDFYGKLAFQLLIMHSRYDPHHSRPDLFLDAVAIEIFPEQVPAHRGK